MLIRYGGKSLQAQSHGDSFIALLQNRFTGNACYVMDEPEATLSPQRPLTVLLILHDLLKDNEEIQFLIATHSPTVLAYPDAQILAFDSGQIQEISHRESQPFPLVSRFVAVPERNNALFSEPADSE